MRRGQPREWIESGACGGPAFALSAAPLFRSRRICQQTAGLQRPGVQSLWPTGARRDTSVKGDGMRS